jgi:hypothetical protein
MSFEIRAPADPPEHLALSGPMLNRLAGSDLVARGSVNVISFKAIRHWAGDWWEKKRDDVWTYVERKLAQHLDRNDLRGRVNEDDFLIAMAQDQGLAAQAASVRILEDVLTHVLGAASPEDLNVRSVVGVGPEGLVCRRVNAAVVLAARARRDSAHSPLRLDIELSDETRRTPVAFTTAGGVALRVDFALEHVIGLRQGVTTAVRIEPIVTHLGSGRAISSRAITRLPDRDAAFIDEAALKFAAVFATASQGHERPDLIVPASFRTLGTQRGRDLLTGTSGLSLAQLRGGVMIELIDITRGTPAGRLLEVVGLLKALTRGVIARIPPEREPLKSLRDARLFGVSLDASDLIGPADKVAAEIMDFGRNAQGLAAMTILQGLPVEGYFTAAETAGLSHAGLRAKLPVAPAQRAAA